MLDFWESMGRVVANEKGLRDRLLSDSTLTAPNPPINCDPKTGAPRTEAFQIATSKYHRLTRILAADLHFQPVSLFCLGEWLRVLPFGFNKLPTTKIKLTGRGYLFYAALGAITVDDTFAGEFADDAASAFPLLNKAERQDVEDLVSLAKDTLPGGYCDVAVTFCVEKWPAPCFVLVRPYVSEPNQTHPSLQTNSRLSARRPAKQSLIK